MLPVLPLAQWSKSPPDPVLVRAPASSALSLIYARRQLQPLVRPQSTAATSDSGMPLRTR